MEKIIVFLPIIIFFGVFGLLIFAFLGFVLKLLMKQKQTYWIGTVIDKKHTQTEDFDSDRPVDTYYMEVRCDGGKEVKAGLSAKTFDEFQIGDRVEKPKGQLHPRKI